MALVTGYHDVRAVLNDRRFAVQDPGPSGPAGSMAWLRASVCRFSNGPEHDARLSEVQAQLDVLDPEALRRSARARASEAISAGRARGLSLSFGDAPDVLTRTVPMETLAAAMDFDDPTAAANHVAVLAPAYFPGAPTDTVHRADAALGRLLAAMSGSAETVVAKVTVMVQACEATAAVITRALGCLEMAGDREEWPTDGLVAEVVRHWPPAPVCRRRATVEVTELHAGRGDEIRCDVEAANHDPAVFDRPNDFDPLRSQPPNLTFGAGIRPCPAREHALALARGVIDGYRHCTDAWRP